MPAAASAKVAASTARRCFKENAINPLMSFPIYISIAGMERF
jgi:hypothetical protein